MRRDSRNAVPVIVVNRELRGERQRFTLAHELGRLAMRVGPGAAAEKAAQTFRRRVPDAARNAAGRDRRTPRVDRVGGVEPLQADLQRERAGARRPLPGPRHLRPRSGPAAVGPGFRSRRWRSAAGFRPFPTWRPRPNSSWGADRAGRRPARGRCRALPQDRNPARERQDGSVRAQGVVLAAAGITERVSRRPCGRCRIPPGRRRGR